LGELRTRRRVLHAHHVRTIDGPRDQVLEKPLRRRYCRHDDERCLSVLGAFRHGEAGATDVERLTVRSPLFPGTRPRDHPVVLERHLDRVDRGIGSHLHILEDRERNAPRLRLEAETEPLDDLADDGSAAQDLDLREQRIRGATEDLLHTWTDELTAQSLAFILQAENALCAVLRKLSLDDDERDERED